jgi:hypothetical protein
LTFAVAGPLALWACHWVSVYSNEEDRRFAEHGVRTKGKVEFRGQDIEWIGPAEDQKPETVFYLHYQYYDGAGQEQRGASRVTKPTWQHYKLGDALAIEYLNDQSDKSRADDRQRSAVTAGLMVGTGAGLALTIIGAALIATAIWRARRRLGVIQHGVPSLGKVTEIVAHGQNGESQGSIMTRADYRIRYSFTDQRGALRDGQTAALPHSVASRWHAGDPILVLYHPNDLFRHEVDLFEARPDDLSGLLNIAR